MSSEKNVPQEKDWWEQEDEGYNTDSKVNTEFLWEEKTKRIIKDRLGVVHKDMDDDGRIIIGEEQENYEDDGEGKIVDEEDDDDDDDDDDNDNDNDDDNDNEEGHLKRRSKRRKK